LDSPYLQGQKGHGEAKSSVQEKSDGASLPAHLRPRPVSRQVARLEDLGLVERRESAADRRVREAAVTAKGKAMTDIVDATRERIGRAIRRRLAP